MIDPLYDRIQSRLDQEDADRFVRRLLILTVLAMVGVMVYALAWWVCGPILPPFGGAR